MTSSQSQEPKKKQELEQEKEQDQIQQSSLMDANEKDNSPPIARDKDSLIVEMPPIKARQAYKNWKVTSPMYGTTTGLTIIYQGYDGSNIYISSKALIRVGSLVTSNNNGRSTYKFQEMTQGTLSRTINYQKQRSPEGELKVNLRFVRVNHDTNKALVYQKVYRSHVASNGIIDLDDLVEQSGVLMNLDTFLEPYFHIVDSNEQYNVDQKEVADDI